VKINKVVLKDFRIHRDAIFEFDEGINLIIGKNGSGKSSILEAIGIALFDADSRSSLQETVRLGAKFACINVEFEANDGIAYVAERRIGNISSFKLIKFGESTARLEGKENVIHKIKDLCGIASNEKNLFQNVISAYQNKFISIFEEKPTKREIIFNQIFDTAIYREMYENYLKVACDNYHTQLFVSQEKLALLKAKLKDSNEIKDNISKLTSEKNLLLIKLNKLNKLVQIKEKKCDKLVNIKSHIDHLSNSIKHISEMIDIKSEQLVNAQNNYDESSKALDIVNQNKLNYQRYEEKSKELQYISQMIDKLEESEKQLNDSKQKLSNAYIKQKEFRTRLEELTNQLEEKQNEVGQKLTLSQQIQQQCKQLELDCSEKENLINYLQDIYSKINGLIQNIEKENQNLLRYQSEIQILQDKIVSPTEIEDLLNAKEKELATLQQKKAKQQEIQKMVDELLTKININEENFNKLKSGICPFLEEECLNLKSRGAPDIFFLDKKNFLLCQKNVLDSQLQNYSNIDEMIASVNFSINNLLNKRNDNLKTNQRINTLLKEKNECMGRINSLQSSLMILFQPFLSEIGKASNEISIEDIKNMMLDKLATAKEQQKSLKLKLDEKMILLDEINKDLKNLEKKVAAIKSNLQEYSEKEIKNNDYILSLNGKIEKLGKEIEELPSLKSNRAKLNNFLRELKQSYDLYSKNINKAKEVKKYQKEIYKLAKQIDNFKKNKNKLNEKLSKLSLSFSEAEFEKEKKELDDKKMEKEGIEKKIYEVDSQLKLFQKELEENLALEKECREYEDKIIILRRKLDLSNNLRDKVGGMGKFIASRLLEHIENIASYNYRNITGRSEYIKWVNNEQESYAVYVANPIDDEWRRFELLSGGEQVVVALALRAAMASVLTKANIIIFDEPTINLDADRKSALANSLKEMMKELRQAIIVTHDETFTEMAQKIIILNR